MKTPFSTGFTNLGFGEMHEANSKIAKKKKLNFIITSFKNFPKYTTFKSYFLNRHCERSVAI
jgi:hypothetical protein